MYANFEAVPAMPKASACNAVRCLDAQTACLSLRRLRLLIGRRCSLRGSPDQHEASSKYAAAPSLWPPAGSKEEVSPAACMLQGGGKEGGEETSHHRHDSRASAECCEGAAGAHERL